MSVAVRVDGLPRLRAALLRLRGEGHRAAAREVKRSTLNVEGGAKRRCPVVTGRTRASITHEISANGLEGVVGTNVPWARRLEFGFVGADVLGRIYNQAAQPFLFPALEEERPQFLTRLRAALGESFVRAS